MVDSKEKYKFDLGVKGLIITDLSIFHSLHCFFWYSEMISLITHEINLWVTDHFLKASKTSCLLKKYCDADPRVNKLVVGLRYWARVSSLGVSFPLIWLLLSNSKFQYWFTVSLVT